MSPVPEDTAGRMVALWDCPEWVSWAEQKVGAGEIGGDLDISYFSATMWLSKYQLPHQWYGVKNACLTCTRIRIPWKMHMKVCVQINYEHLCCMEDSIPHWLVWIILRFSGPVPCDLNWSLRMMMSMAKQGSSASQGFPWCLQQINTEFPQFQHQGNGSRQRACSMALLVRIPQVFCQAWTQQPSRMVRNLLLQLLSRVQLCATP